jgi:hypothetical protein
MSKTNNFHFFARVLQFLSAACLVNLGRVDFTIKACEVTAWGTDLLDLRDEALA